MEEGSLTPPPLPTTHHTTLLAKQFFHIIPQNQHVRPFRLVYYYFISSFKAEKR